MFGLKRKTSSITDGTLLRLDEAIMKFVRGEIPELRLVRYFRNKRTCIKILGKRFKFRKGIEMFVCQEDRTIDLKTTAEVVLPEATFQSIKRWLDKVEKRLFEPLPTKIYYVDYFTSSF